MMQAIFETVFDIVYLVGGADDLRRQGQEAVSTVVLCLAQPLSNKRPKGRLRGGLGAGDFPHCTMPDASKRMAKCPDAPLMGHLPQHSLYPFGCADRGAVLPQRKGKAG